VKNPTNGASAPSTSRRGKPRLAGRFTRVPNKLIDDKRLPIEARFVLIWMAHLPTHRSDGTRWVHRQSVVAAELGIGRTKTQQIFRRLIQYGYLKRHGQTRRGKEWGEARYTIIQTCLQEYIRPGCDDAPAKSHTPDDLRSDCGTGTFESNGAGNPQFAGTLSRYGYRTTMAVPLNKIIGTSPSPDGTAEVPASASEDPDRVDDDLLWIEARGSC
jgi:hypothetical protein